MHIFKFFTDRFNEALQEAREIDIQIKTGNKSTEEMKFQTPLLGLPLTVKESIMVKGMSNTSGRFYKNKYVASEDAPIVKNAKKHGAVILCVTNTPELCLCWETYNKVRGTTRNPYDVRRTPGGSSGGEAALLGCGASLLGLGSDVAGSCRLPAMFVGVYGHKPTPFVTSPYGHNPQSDDPRWGNFFTTAPMTRYAQDLPLLLDAVREEDGTKVELFKEVDVYKIKFHVMDSDNSGMTQSLSPCIKKSLVQVANYFNAKEVKFELMKWALDISMAEMLTLPFDTIYTKTEEGRKQKTAGREFLKYISCQSESIMSSVMISSFQFAIKKLPERRKRQLENIRKKLKEDILKTLGDDGVLLYPTFPTSANKHYEIYCGKLLDPIYLMVFNTLGLPVTQVNTGFDKNNLPIGIQVVTSPGNDHLSLTVAYECQKKFGGWIAFEEAEAKFQQLK
jgi:fatty acid amide hydrolase 2